MRRSIRKLVCAAVLILSVAMVSAETPAFDSVCASLAEHPVTTGNFVQIKKITSANRLLKSSGTFIFSLEGIMWKTQKPFASSLVDGITSVIQTTPDGKRTVIDASGNQIFTSISATLSSIFSGNNDGLKKNFMVLFSADGSAWSAELTPKDSTVTAVMKSLTISGASAGGKASLDSIIMKESGGDTIIYTFTDQKYPEELTDEERAEFTAK
jgi:hypothetical protein